MIFAIDGREYPSLHVTMFRYATEILDGAGTGRTQAKGWPMHREPQGVIKNIELELAIPDSNTNDDFINLLAVLDSFGTRDFRMVEFITPTESIRQLMYGASYKLDLVRLKENGISYWGNLAITFIAKEAITT